MRPLPRGLAGILVLVGLAPLAAHPAAERVAEERVAGTLHVIWDDEPRSDDRDGRRFFVVRADGTGLEVAPERTIAGAADADRLTRRDRRAVEVRGPRVGGVIRAREVREVGEAREGSLPSSADMVALASSPAPTQDFVTLLCRFADQNGTPFTRGAVQTIHGPSYPGMRQYYAELSWNPEIMTGSEVTGWYDLPEPRSHYVDGHTTQWGRLARDCTAAAEVDVDFRRFTAINLQVSGDLATRSSPPHDVLSYGGSWTLTLNGETRGWGMTWLSGRHKDSYVVVAHEMGHALGWPHSSGEYGSEYDSEWDVMSRGYLRWEPPFGWLTVHTIAPHKDHAGWVAPDRRWIPAADGTETGVIRRTADPSGDGYLMARIPLAHNTFYTVESRRLAGHDRPLPAEAILIHEVRSGRAYVVEDPEQRGDPNGPGAAWQPGQTFRDAARGVLVRVDEQLEDGFVVTVSRGTAVTCTIALTAQPASGGSVSLAEGSQDGACGRTVTISAAPNEGWAFVHWVRGDASASYSETHTRTVSGDESLIARFVRADDLADRLVRRLLGEGSALTAAEATMVDRTGNHDGEVDVGDLMAWLDRYPEASP